MKPATTIITPEAFVARWGKNPPLLRFPKDCIDRLQISPDDKKFLIEAGLPESAAPFLSFELPRTPNLPTIAQQYGIDAEFARFRVIGSDGSGNPIALDEKSQGEVVLLDHENRFARVTVNQSIGQLAESLLAYRKLVEDSQAEFGQDAFLDGKSSPEARQQLRNELARIDPAAVQPGCFWHGELQNVDASAS